MSKRRYPAACYLPQVTAAVPRINNDAGLLCGDISAADKSCALPCEEKRGGDYHQRHDEFNFFLCIFNFGILHKHPLKNMRAALFSNPGFLFYLYKIFRCRLFYV